MIKFINKNYLDEIKQMKDSSKKHKELIEKMQKQKNLFSVLLSLQEIKAKQEIKYENIIFKKPGAVGLSSLDVYNLFKNKKMFAKRKIPKNEPINLEDISTE